MDTYNNSPKNSTSIDDCPIIREHYGYSHDAFGKRWIPPNDRDFTDRPPPGAPGSAKPKPSLALDVVAALRAKWRAA